MAKEEVIPYCRSDPCKSVKANSGVPRRRNTIIVKGVVRRVCAAGGEVDSGKNVTVEAEEIPMSESSDSDRGRMRTGHCRTEWLCCGFFLACGTERNVRC
jgi:hypothetical protein